MLAAGGGYFTGHPALDFIIGLGIVAAAIGGAFKLVGSVARFTHTVGRIHDEVIGTEEHPSLRKSIEANREAAEAADALAVEALALVRGDLATVQRQTQELMPNGGTSVADRVRTAEYNIAELNTSVKTLLARKRAAARPRTPRKETP